MARTVNPTATSLPAATLSPARLLVPLLALIGTGISGYLTYVKFSSTQAVCLGLGECETVQNSPYAVVLGVPIALLGLLAYVGILFLWWWSLDTGRPFADLAPVVLFGLAFFGFLFSLYLTYLELFVIHAICPWCVASAILMTLLTAFSARKALLPEDLSNTL